MREFIFYPEDSKYYNEDFPMIVQEFPSRLFAEIFANQLMDGNRRYKTMTYSDGIKAFTLQEI